MRRKRTSQPYYILVPKQSAGGQYYQVMLHCNYNGNRLDYYTGVRTLPEYWDEEKQNDNGKAIPNPLPKKDVAIKKKLENMGITRTTESVKVTRARLKGILHMAGELLEDLKRAPSPKSIKDALNAKYNTSKFIKPAGQTTLYDLINKFIEGEISNRGRAKSNSTIKQYKLTLNKLTAFEKAEKYSITFDSVNLAFYHKFVSYLRKEGNKDNTIGSRIKNIKTFMTEANEQGLTTNVAHKSRNFAKPRKDTDAVYLRDVELLKLYEHDFSNDKRLEQIRDLFLIGCYTGLRFSDYNNIKPANIVKDKDGDLRIKIITQKTGELVEIPCNPIILDILERYKDSPRKLPKPVTNQVFNRYVKEVCKAAGLTEPGRLSTEMDKPLYECVSSHTARRSFATNLHLTKYPTLEIMKITGHKTEAAFYKYVKISKAEAADNLKEHTKQQHPKKGLRIA